MQQPKKMKNSPDTLIELSKLGVREHTMKALSQLVVVDIEIPFSLKISAQ